MRSAFVKNFISTSWAPSFWKTQKRQNMDYSLVKVDGGHIKGETLNSALNDESYYSFKGIPFASTPVGPLRFQPPKQVKPWEGVLQCTSDKEMCWQKQPFGGPSPVIAGSEDCLYLNVFFPVKHSDGPLRPVMVFIHGGGFQMGSSNSAIYGPDFLITKDIVLVTINYRLNVLGFLNLGIKECPGNVGLLDQRAALAWVKKHINKFTGDPDNITIFGESAGSASVSYHLMSPLSKGLYNKAVLQSGCAFDPWAYMDPKYSVDRAFRIGERLGCKTADVKELHEFLLGVPAKDLVEVTLNILTPEDIKSGFVFPFAPSKETFGNFEDRFIPDDPKTLLTEAISVPILMGLNSAEGLVIFLENPKMAEKVSKNPGAVLDTMFPRELESLSKDNVALDAARTKVKQFYLKDLDVSGSAAVNKFADFFGDLNFTRGNYQWLKTCSSLPRPNPMYVYSFDYRGEMSLSQLAGYPTPDFFSGACHGDELMYLFNFQMFNSAVLETESCRRVSENLTTVWTNFAKSGNPGGELKPDWKPINSSEMVHCNINEELKIQPGFMFEERIKFWDDLRLSILNQSKL